MLTLTILLAAWLLYGFRLAKGWRWSVRSRVWFHRTQPTVTYCNQPDECRFALPSWRRL